MRWLSLVLVGLAAPAVACPWDYETYAAEWKALPCLAPVAAGLTPSHSPWLWNRKLEIADFELAFAPRSVESLDARVVALLHLARAPEAVEAARRRLALTPSAYEAHANLATARTFTGAFDEALAEIDAALAITPDAHFGRERVHRQLVVYLQRGQADGGVFVEEDFLGRRMSLARLKELEASAPADEAALIDSIQAVVAMLAVYGAERVPHLWLALGNLALEARLPRTAWAAWERARTLKHPRAGELKQWQARLEKTIEARWVPSPKLAQLLRRHALSKEEGGWAGMSRSDEHERQRFTAAWSAYERRERVLVTKGLPFWREDGAQALFDEQVKLGLRCPTGNDQRPTVATDAQPSVFLSLRSSQSKCADVVRELKATLESERDALAQARQDVLPRRDVLDGLASARARCGSALDALVSAAR